MLKNKTKFIKQKLETLTEEYGSDIDTLLYAASCDSVVPGICMNEDCDFVVDSCEPDARENWCECCETNTVCSLVELALFM